jgi:hypothetical protein
MTDKPKIPIIAAAEKRLKEAIGAGNIGKFLKKNNFQMFTNQDPSENVALFTDVLKTGSYELTCLPNSPWEIKFAYKKQKGVAKVYLLNKYDPEKPSFIFHHGLGEIFYRAFLDILIDKSYFDKFNIFAIKAGNHESAKNIFNNFLSTFDQTVSNIFGSIMAINEIIKYHKSQSTKKCVVAGFSLGGTIISLHYFHFGSADYYFPINSYPNMGEIFFDEIHAGLIHNYQLLKKNVSFQKCFEIPIENRQQKSAKIFPILSKYDVTVHHPCAKKFWKNYQTLIVNTGHISVLLEAKKIRSYILSKIQS